MTPSDYTDEELKAIRKEYAAGSSDEQFTIFISECKRRGLTPGRHIVFQTRRAKEYDSVTNSYQWVSKPVYITTISALLLIAQRTGEYEGQGRGKYIYTPLPDESTTDMFIESAIPLPDSDNPRYPRIPWVAEATVYRKGFREPMIGQARFEAYASYQKSGDGNGRQLTQMWASRCCEQLLKCATAAALRSAFPEETSGLYIQDEMRQDEEQPAAPTAVTPASVVPLPPPVPAVNQTPAVGTESPRPNETAPTPTETGNAAYADKMTPEEVSQHSQALAKKEAKPEKKQTRKAKPEETVPEKPVDGGITDEDLKTLDAPPPVPVDEEQIKKEADEFIEAIDPTPTKEEQHGFTTRVRALSAAGAKSEDLKNYILDVGKKSDTKQLTVRDWRQALDQLEAAQADGKLVEVSKAAPLPAF